jgi:hypothetical protein
MGVKQNDAVACGYILPTFDRYLTKDGECNECVLPSGHDGEHLSVLPDGRRIFWAYDPCNDCPAGECECFCYHEGRPSKR